jgi:hypothetical protein
MDQTREMMTVQNKVKKLKEIATQLIDRMVDLIVVFVLNTIVLPLLFLGAVYKLGRGIQTLEKIDWKMSLTRE